MSSLTATRTARTITATAKRVTAARWVTTSQGPYSFRVVLMDANGTTDSVLGRAASDAICALDGMTTTWGRARNGKIVINVTDETAREAAIAEQETARAAALEAARAEVADARYGELLASAPVLAVRLAADAAWEEEAHAAGFATGDEYGALLTEELPEPAEEPAYGCVQHIERGPECGPDCEELTASYALTPATVTLTNPELWA
jgi:hypothetical protein